MIIIPEANLATLCLLRYPQDRLTSLAAIPALAAMMAGGMSRDVCEGLETGRGCSVERRTTQTKIPTDQAGI